MKNTRQDIKSAFEKEWLKLCHSRVIYFTIVNIVFNISFALTDPIVIPWDLAKNFLVVRLVVTLSIAVLFYPLVIKTKRYLSFIYLSDFFIILQVTYFCYKTGGFNSPFYFGYIIAITCTGLFIPWKGTSQFLLGFSAQLVYFCLYLNSSFNTSIIVLLVQNFYIFIITVLTTIFSSIQYRLNYRLIEQDFYKTDFFNNISHELKTPLSLVLLPLERVLKKNKVDREDASFLEVAYQNTKRLNTLVNTLLDTSKIEAGKMPLKIQMIRPLEICKNILERSKPALEEKKLIPVFRSSGNPEIYADAELFQRIVENLYSNAIKFSDKLDQKIITTISETDKNITIKIKDYGIGLSHEELSHLFERFYQSDSSLTRNYSGTGIGLYYAKELLRLHKSDFTVHSKKGGGTEFSFTLSKGNQWFKQVDHSLVFDDQRVTQLESPVVIPAKAGIQSLSASLDPCLRRDDTTHDTVILIVEDNAQLRSLIASFLTDKYRVLEASNGKEGIEIAIHSKPDLIITDLMMPLMNGYEMIEALRKNPIFINTPIIILTAHTNSSVEIAKGFEIGANDYLTKPFSVEELLARTKNLTELKKRNDELNESRKNLIEAQSEVIRSKSLSMVGELAAGVAHNINTYISGADIGISMALKKELPESPNNEILKTVLESVRHTKDLISNLQNFAINNRQEYDSWEIHEGIENALKMFELLPEYKSVTVHKDFSKPILLTCNIKQLNAAFLNLFKNAAQAKAHDIWIHTSKIGNDVLITIRDNGSGIPDSVRERIFDPFFTTKQVGEGTGLGLWMVHKTITEHGGSIILNKDLKEGTEFIMSLKEKPV